MVVPAHQAVLLVVVDVQDGALDQVVLDVVILDVLFGLQDEHLLDVADLLLDQDSVEANRVFGGALGQVQFLRLQFLLQGIFIGRLPLLDVVLLHQQEELIVQLEIQQSLLDPLQRYLLHLLLDHVLQAKQFSLVLEVATEEESCDDAQRYLHQHITKAVLLTQQNDLLQQVLRDVVNEAFGEQAHEPRDGEETAFHTVLLHFQGQFRKHLR